MTFSSISSLKIVLAMAAVAFELPSGVIADRYGRKVSMVLSAAARVAAHAFVVSSTGHGSFATAFLFFGIGVAFQSGAINAWLVESQIQELGHASDGKANIQKRLALFGTVGNVGKAAGAVMGGFAYAADASLPWKVSLGLFVVAVVLLLLVAEPPRPLRAAAPVAVPGGRRLRGALSASVSHAKTAARVYWVRPMLMWITAYACVSQIGMTGIIKVWQPWFSPMLGDGAKALLGVVWMCFVAANLLANRAVRDSSGMADSRRLLIGSLLSGLPLIGVALSGVLWLALPLYLLHVFGETFKDPILYGILHHEVESDNRATVESFYSLITSLAEAAGFLMMGFALDRWGMQLVIFLCASFFVISGIFASGRVNERHANAKPVGHPAGA